ncbi:hypothetical protein SPAB_01709 [Salmonella enterica subsp. enterica serovar Paratyphi B str. SPB7]|uniref:Uncharacterized protein n=1 Tax=Salmonella paratyphi B (strain ATCC BAA-1250 / SPB7) TaxID=1016998 RepID=A0A6C6Z0N7_SALPB|nr:hypothetical protein SPAB_01709 [Salmonella enterica subsp. enterica serovar Paratyphi B str. SPB7]
MDTFEKNKTGRLQPPEVRGILAYKRKSGSENLFATRRQNSGVLKFLTPAQRV